MNCLFGRDNQVVIAHVGNGVHGIRQAAFPDEFIFVCCLSVHQQLSRTRSHNDVTTPQMNRNDRVVGFDLLIPEPLHNHAGTVPERYFSIVLISPQQLLLASMLFSARQRRRLRPSLLKKAHRIRRRLPKRTTLVPVYSQGQERRIHCQRDSGSRRPIRKACSIRSGCRASRSTRT